MDNRQAALMLFALTLIVAFIAWSYDNALTGIVNEQCSHGPTCPMHATIDAQRSLAMGLIALLVVASALIFFWVPATRIVKELVRQKPKQPVKLEGDEKQIFELVQKSGGTIYQGDILKQTGFSKVKVSRILDRLEKAELVERKRRGMANLVAVK